MNISFACSGCRLVRLQYYYRGLKSTYMRISPTSVGRIIEETCDVLWNTLRMCLGRWMVSMI